MEALCDTLAEYKKIMDGYRVDSYESYAVAALRNAENELFILDQIRIRTGLLVKVLSNSEHRFISYKSVAMREDFERMIQKGAAVVDFSAVWCGPCQMLAPVMEELSEELSGKAEFYIADSDENKRLAQEYRIVSIPAVIVLKDGVEVARTVGFQPKDAMRSFIEEHLN